MVAKAKRIMRAFKLDEISAVDIPAQQGAVMTLMKRNTVTKAIGTQRFLAEDFAYVGNEKDAKTWKFLLTNEPGGEPNPVMVERVIKAVGDIMDGNTSAQPQKYHIPDDALNDVLDKLRQAWLTAFPDSSSDEMPAPITPDANAVDDGTGDNTGGSDGTDPNAADASAADASAVDPNADPAAVDPNAAPEAAPKPKGKPPKGKNPFVGKRALTEGILKRYIDPADGARTFADIIDCYEEDRKFSEVMNLAWPLISALDTSLRSIIADQDIDAGDKPNLLRTSVEEFLSSVKDTLPEVEGELSKALHAASNQEKELMKVSTAAGATSSVEKQLADLAAKQTELTAALATEKTARETAEKALVTFKAVAGLTADEKDFYDKCKDEPAKASFLALEKSARTAAVKKAISDDETMTVDGVMVIKSVIGDGMFAILKSQQAKNVVLEKAVATEREKREEVELTKRAETELGHMPGKIEDKVALLKQLDTMPESVRVTAKQLLSAADKTASHAFVRLGVNGPGIIVAKGADSTGFEKKVSEIKNTEKCSRQEALRKARQQHPEEFAAWQGEQS